MSVTYEPGSTKWIPGRGDYGSDHSSDLIGIIEERNCVKGCARSGTARERREFGPGGTCDVLAVVARGDGETPIPELDPRKEGPFCRARIEPPPPTRRPRRTRAGMEPLFPEVAGG